ncbi:MAG: Tad domain-containing protein [Anaerolineales bacterium]|nr:Tad domain-containing protein [Anaerolineales bacterium]
MNLFNKFQERFNTKQIEEEGQSIVLISLILVALLLFVGLAVDVGFVFARTSQLQAAVDAAALSGVSEIINETNPSSTILADTKAGQFLNANGVPITGTTGITITFQSSRGITPLGVTEYSVTVTWPVELFFLRLIRREPVNVTRSATAAISYLTDIYASRRVEDGTVTTSTQGIFGPQICTEYGDAFSPINSIWDPDFYTYQYRIMIPADYNENVVRVELFDPDSVNQADNEHTIALTENALTHPTNPLSDVPPPTKFCGIHGGGSEQKNPCVLRTGELELTPSGTSGVTPTYSIDQVNPFWFVRIDENRGAGDPDLHGNGQCVSGSPASYEPRFNTQTRFELYYYQANPGGRDIRTSIASYTGNTGDARDVNGFHDTDMHWVSPGADKQGFDYPIPDVPGVSEVPTDEGNTSFEVDLTSDVSGIVTDINTGVRYLYLDVTSLSGASENGFEIWAGPADYAETEPSDVNARNVKAINVPGSHNSNGVVIFALGRLPMNSVIGNAVDIPLVFVGAEQAGAPMTISLFDTDSGAQPPIEFYFDSINKNNWSKVFSNPPDADPDGQVGRCEIGNCNDQWVTPAYQLTVPGVLDNCDYQNQNPDDCTPFYGGRLMVNYIGGEYDSYSWQIQISGLPFLVR